MPKKKITQAPPATVISKTPVRKTWLSMPANFRGTGSFSRSDFKRKDVSS